MNVFCVSGRRAGAPTHVPWPMKDDDATGEKQWTLFRGTRITQDALQWYEQAFSNQTIYRAPIAIATTRKGTLSIDFMTEKSYPRDALMAQWVFHIDPRQKCVHINCLEPVTLLSGEEEFLLPPYSSFRTQKVEMLPHPTLPGQSFYRIDVYVMPDNREVAKGGPIID